MKPTCDLELSLTRHDQRAYAVDFRYTDGNPDNQATVRLGVCHYWFRAWHFSKNRGIAQPTSFFA